MKTKLFLIKVLILSLLLILLSCGSGPYHRVTIRNCEARGLTGVVCTDDYYKNKEKKDSWRYERNSYRRTY